MPLSLTTRKETVRLVVRNTDQKHLIKNTVTNAGGYDMLVMGVDPGKTGAIACIDDGILKWVLPFKGDIDLCRKIGYRGVTYFIERVTASPQMGVVSAFTFGKWAEAVECSAILSDSPVHMVRPQVWQNAIGVYSQGDKSKLYEHAKRLFPEQYVEKKFNKDTSDSVLIAYYGWRYLVNQEEK